MLKAVGEVQGVPPKMVDAAPASRMITPDESRYLVVYFLRMLGPAKRLFNGTKPSKTLTTGFPTTFVIVSGRGITKNEVGVPSASVSREPPTYSVTMARKVFRASLSSRLSRAGTGVRQATETVFGDNFGGFEAGS